jgi:hypothetical protein
MLELDKIVGLIQAGQKTAAVTAGGRINRTSSAPTSHDTEDYVGVGLDGILAASGKLLAVNRGEATTDERDSLAFKRIMTPDRLMRERVRIDADKSGMKLMRALARKRTLKAMTPFHFDNYATGLLLGNPLSSPLEEINPMHIVEQARRVTLMGPGGIGTPQAITSGMQAVHASQFGFLDPLHGPECFPASAEVFTWEGWKPWPTVTLEDKLACRIDGRLEFHKPERLVAEPYAGPLLVAEHSRLRMAVTPGHRVLNMRDGLKGRERMDYASEVEGKGFKIPIRHLPLLGDESRLTWELPVIPVTNSNQKVFGPLDVFDWSEFLGWWLSEGSSNAHKRVSSGGSVYDAGYVRVSQCPVANPEQNLRLRALMQRLGLMGDTVAVADAYHCGAKQVVAYFSQWTGGCYDKWIPDEVFSFPVEARRRLMESLLMGDGRDVANRRQCYCTVSFKLARSVELLAVSLGMPAFIREERDARAHVKTTNYVVSMSLKHTTQVTPSNSEWSREDYEGVVYCATVPGGLLLVRGKPKTRGYWSGNSERAGIDSRLAWGTRIGSDGRIYQQFTNRRTGKTEWLSPDQLDGKTIRLPA